MVVLRVFLVLVLALQSECFNEEALASIFELDEEPPTTMATTADPNQIKFFRSNRYTMDGGTKFVKVLKMEASEPAATETTTAATEPPAADVEADSSTAPAEPDSPTAEPMPRVLVVNDIAKRAVTPEFFDSALDMYPERKKRSHHWKGQRRHWKKRSKHSGWIWI